MLAPCLQVVERFTAHYVFALGLSRFMSCAHWLLQVSCVWCCVHNLFLKRGFGVMGQQLVQCSMGATARVLPEFVNSCAEINTVRSTRCKAMQVITV